MILILNWRHNLLPLLLLLLILGWMPVVSHAAEAPASARIVDLEGEVEFILDQKSAWKPARAGEELHAGDMIRTGPLSRVSLLMADESLIKLKESSDFVIDEVAPSSYWNLETAKQEKPPSINSEFTLKKGGAWFLNKNREVAITFKTPTAEVGVRGTELVVQLDPAQTLQVAALEGSARIANSQGELVIASGEEAVTQPGGAPVKQLLLHPENVVQWVITVPAFFTPRDLQLSGPGWQELEKGRIKEALEIFSRNDRPETTDQLGKIATLILLKRYQDASALLTSARKAHPGEYRFELQQAWLDLMTGALVRASKTLAAVTASHPREVVGWQLRALTALALDRREEMKEAARQATTVGAESPTSWIILAYVQQAQFLMEEAEASVRKALSIDPENITGLIVLARLEFGSGRTPDALTTIDQAERLARDHAEVNNLRGFILFALRKNEDALRVFRQAARQDTTLAEPHMGMGLTYMRLGQTARAFEEISTAVLLDPRRSLTRSYWAKMLYQAERHTKALDVLKMARLLDPRDPTPHLYEALILRDLNLPTQAIHSINQAIALNDNRAVYRSRFLLDGDLAVKNVDLSKLFNQLELPAWARNKAVAATRQDYTNSAGHLFYAGALADEEGRSWARNTETLLARLLQPANQNTFNSFNNYTSFVEKPGMDVDLTATVGNHGTFNRAGIVSGAAPQQNLAYQAGYIENDTDGWRAGHGDRARSVVGYLKWDPSENSGVMLAASQTDTWQKDQNGRRFEFDTLPAPRDSLESTTHRLEGGYHHHFGPGADLLLHAEQIRTPLDMRTVSRLDPALLKLPAGSVIDANSGIRLTSDFYQVQGEVLFKRHAHQILAGAVHYGGSEAFTNATQLEVLVPPLGNFALPAANADQKRTMETLFVQDIYQLTPSLILEGDLHFDRIKTGSVTNQTTWSQSQWSPRLGLIWTPLEHHTLRLAGFRSMLPFISDRLDPADIAGVPVHRNGTAGSSTDEAQLVWEYETTDGLWSAGLFHADREYPEIAATGNRMVWGSRIGGLELQHNRLLGKGLGMLARYRFQQVSDPFSERSSTVNRDEHLLEAGLKWVHESGWSARAKESYRLLDFTANRATENIWITDLDVAYAFPGKKGSVGLKVDNLFNEHFNWVTDPFVFQGRDPAREIFLTVNVSF
ncbi:MAG: TonB-dependent receptor [Magnetococcales bacterium]|nr:TonB-dependent receptor [Magnetococcales bacterium]